MSISIESALWNLTIEWNWQALCQQLHKCPFSSLSVYLNACLAEYSLKFWNLSEGIFLSIFFLFLKFTRSALGRKFSFSVLLQFFYTPVLLFSRTCWQSKQISVKSCGKFSSWLPKHSALKQVVWNKIFNGLLWIYTYHTVHCAIESICCRGKQNPQFHVAVYLLPNSSIFMYSSSLSTSTQKALKAY